MISLDHTLSSTILPIGAWDSHVHVIDEDRFPLHKSHPYRPEKATILDLNEFHKRIGIAHACLVAVSVYHTDSRSILDALAQCKGVNRAVIAIDPDSITQDDLFNFHQAGVRGVRINIHTRKGKLDLHLLQITADKIRSFGWVLQLYIGLDQMVELNDIISKLNITIVIDHLASPDPNNGPAHEQRGYKEFISLLKQGKIWTKLSGTYRFANLPDLDKYIYTILSQASDRVVWASDWPHTSGVNFSKSIVSNEKQPYRQIDDHAWIVQCKKWFKDVSGDRWEDLARKIWVENPKKLWQFE